MARPRCVIWRTPLDIDGTRAGSHGGTPPGRFAAGGCAERNAPSAGPAGRRTDALARER
ncbi:hypothetical protein [Micromonospora inyonensis]|uniref:hypothetical protein n=1 Tax=Micromonospora inyonensis TaxID=47866 RepID=UPI00159F3232|nr:hypothetical protein [Micromonospora inyonensis]